MGVRCEVHNDGERLLARLSGRLDMAAAGSVRAALARCLAEQPTALLVDISDLDVVDTLAVTVFTTVVRQAAIWPGTPVLLCAPSPATAAVLAGGAYRRLMVFPTVAAARVEARDNRRVLPAVIQPLLPVAGAARLARDTATDACVRWDLPWLIGPACLVAGELVSNGAEHAATLLTLRLSLSARLLHVAVRDGSPAVPRLSDDPWDAPRGRGLRLVDAVSRSWGHLPTNGGKVVWAVLSTSDPGAGP